MRKRQTKESRIHNAPAAALRCDLSHFPTEVSRIMLRAPNGPANREKATPT